MQIGDRELTEEEEIYKENILDHYKHPRNTGTLPECTVHHHEHNPLCGDRIEIFLTFTDETCTDAKFVGQGCAISQASMSMLSEQLKGKTVDDIKRITSDDILSLLGIPVGIVRIKCALLSLKTVHVGISHWENFTNSATTSPHSVKFTETGELP
ncbi:SUF system NifU family Fe-S cluster assembly protein [Candidatus Woesearchaeota archaeon]|nr:SUF system NifU family Fe-S cluster assembly protein [Candidatus Woesearchaeota archaeon]